MVDAHRAIADAHRAIVDYQRDIVDAQHKKKKIPLHILVVLGMLCS